jgi:steroid 5-alpha reductase family enzyme
MNNTGSLMHAAALGLAASGVVAALTWAASVLRRDVSIVDSVWSVLVLVPACVALVVLPQAGPRAAVVLLLAAVWAVRLAVYITWRHWGHDEDHRYREIRARKDSVKDSPR